MPGAPTPTPSPRPVSEGYVSPADYLAMELGRLQAMNQNQTVSLKDMIDYVAALQSTVAASET